MVQLPTEQAIGELPDRLPRRAGVGGWQPGDLARGAQELARGGETFGLDLGMLSGAMQRQQNQAEQANADSFIAVRNVRNSQQLANETDPVKAAGIKDQINSDYDTAAGMVNDPNERTKKQLTWAPQQAQMQVGVDNHVKGLVNNQAVANYDDYRNTAITTALSTDDPKQRTDLYNGIGARGQALVNSGALTPEQLQERGAQDAHNYGVGWLDSAKTRAQAHYDPTTGAFVPGDTRELESIQRMYQFEPNAPGGWGQPAGGPAPGATGMGTINAAYTAPLDQPGEKGIVSPAQHYSYLISKGATPNEALMLTGAAASESSFNATAIHDNGNGYGLYGHNTQRLDLRGQPWQQQATSALAELRSRPEATLVNAAQTPQQLADAEMQFERPRGFTEQNPRAGDNYTGRLNTINYFSQMATGSPVAGGAGAPAQRPTAANSYFIGDSVADGLRRAAGADGDTAKSRNPEDVQDAIGDADPKDLQGKTIYLSTGASNNPKAAGALADQLDSLKAKGVDMGNVRVIGVGDRSDFTANNVNATLASIAGKAGATFTGPLDTSNLVRKGANTPTNSDYGVHPADPDKALAQVSGTNAIAQPISAAGPSAFVGLPPAGASGPNPHLVPPQSQWPADATGVKMGTDGTLNYTMADGSTRPVPGSRATGAFGSPSPSKTGTPLDFLKPVERAELGLQAQNAIDEINRQNEAAAKQYYTQAHKDIDGSTQRLINGNGIGPNESAQMTQKYATSPVPEVRQDYATFKFIQQNIDSFKGQSPQTVQARANNMQAEYNRSREANPDDPNLPLAAAAANAATQFAKLFREQANKTPLERASLAGGLPGGLTSLNPQDPNIVAKIALRVSDAHTASDFLSGTTPGSVPIKYLQQVDRPIFKQIAKQGGQPLVDLTRNIVEGAGADAGAWFKELGGDSSGMQWMGMYAAMGGDPEPLNDRAGVLQAKNEKKDLPTFGKSFASNFYGSGDSPLGSAMSGFTAAHVGMIHDAASDLMTAQALRDGKPLQVTHTDYDKDFVDKAYNLALGATIQPDGTQYGGIAKRTIGGGWWGLGGTDNRVVIPNNIKANDFDKVIGQIAPEDIKALPLQPQAKNQLPITARQIQDGLLQAFPDKDGIFRGKYGVYTDGVSDDDHMVRNPDGSRWILDLAQPSLDTSLRKKIPDAYLGGVEGAKIPTPLTPTKQTYGNAPGVVALSGAAEQE